MSDVIEQIREDFADFERGLNGLGRTSIHQWRKDNLQRFVTDGFPTSANEDWKYTNISAFVQNNYRRSKNEIALTQEQISQLDLPTLSGQRMVFFDGHFVREFSQGGASVSTLTDVLAGKSGAQLQQIVESTLGSTLSAQSSPIVALNSAFMFDGVVLSLTSGEVLTEPLHLIFISSGQTQTISYLRNLYLIGPSCSAQVIEHFVSLEEKNAATSVVSEAVVDENGHLEVTKIANESLNSFHLGTFGIRQKRDSYFQSTVLSFGGSLIRNEVLPIIDGENCETVLNGLSIAKGSQLIDNYTVIDHAKPLSRSHELYKGVYADKSVGVFCGTIIVRPDAQKTNAIQSNNSLLLSDEAAINAKPQLKIWADDVRCTHGATVGQLDENALFYLRSRGIGKVQAKNLLIYAFVSDIIRHLSSAEVRTYSQQLLENNLQAQHVMG